ncbi:hypothetical protein CAPN002_06200 [Capnocytophaga stomatis]|nr:hypothetical protein [Capnocytophaga stomatis]GIJ93402.1 hypothetical protein CAPN002_06200 [Capnocytophaga stomatis]
MKYEKKATGNLQGLEDSARKIHESLKALNERYYNINSLARYIDIYRLSQNDPIEFWETI